MTPLEINKKIAKLKNIIAYQNNWSEDIGDAWELFEEITTDAGIYRCFPEGSYQCEIEPFIFENAETAPIAICLAWIAWKTGKAVE